MDPPASFTQTWRDALLRPGALLGPEARLGWPPVGFAVAVGAAPARRDDPAGPRTLTPFRAIIGA